MLEPTVINEPESFVRGKGSYGLGHYELAIQQLEIAANEQPDYAATFYYLGKAYLSVRRMNDAVEAFNCFLQSQPNCADTLDSLGVCYQNLNQLANALSCYNLALFINPDHFSARHNRGNYYVMQNDFDKALIDLNRALTIRAYSPHVLLSLANMYDKMGQYAIAETTYLSAKTQCPISDIDTLNAINVNLTETLLSLGHVLYQDDKFISARCYYERALDISPHNACALTQMGMTFYKLGSFSTAFPYFKTVSETAKDPSDIAVAKLNMASCLREQGCLREALELANAANELTPDDEDVLDEIATIEKAMDSKKTVGTFFTSSKVPAPPTDEQLITSMNRDNQTMK